MKISRAAFLGLMACGVLSIPAAAEPRTIKFASVQIITGDDGKDDTDVLTITVTDTKGKVLERIFDARQEIKPGTTFSLFLNKARNEPIESLKDAKIVFRVAPQGDKHWVVKDAQLSVIDENGAPDKWHWGPFVLETKASKPFQLEYPLTDDKRVK